MPKCCWNLKSHFCHEFKGFYNILQGFCLKLRHKFFKKCDFFIFLTLYFLAVKISYLFIQKVGFLVMLNAFLIEKAWFPPMWLISLIAKIVYLKEKNYIELPKCAIFWQAAKKAINMRSLVSAYRKCELFLAFPFLGSQKNLLFGKKLS